MGEGLESELEDELVALQSNLMRRCASGLGNLSGSIYIRYHASRPIETFRDGLELEV